jgi:hypothetical protein
MVKRPWEFMAKDLDFGLGVWSLHNVPQPKDPIHIFLLAIFNPYLQTLDKIRPLGPLHTRAKSLDHEIVRAQKKVPKGHPNPPPKSCSVGHRPSNECEVIRDRALNQMPFQ